MRILAVSDIHDDETALESIESLSKDYDHVFIAGDSATTNYFAEKLVSLLPEAFIIPGNNESRGVIEVLEKAENYVHGKRMEIEDGLNIVGFGFSNFTPFGTPGELSEEEIEERTGRLRVDENTLLLLHCPPKGFFDEARGENTGSTSILRFIESRKPFAAFFGHIHEHRGTAGLGQTTLVKIPAANSMGAAAVEISNKRITVGFVSL